MAIRDVVTWGFGPGAPGFIPTFGFSSGASVVPSIPLITLETITRPGMSSEAIALTDLTLEGLASSGMTDEGQVN